MNTISLLSEDIETYKIELKAVEKFTKGSDNEDWGKCIVGLANRYGGQLIIGKNNDGSYQGKNIFDIFKSDSKSGIDKLKEKIDNFCLNQISPPVICNIEFQDDENGDLLIVNVPKRTSIPHAIVSDRKNIVARKYYIKTSHGTKPISNDKQLEWLFKSIDDPILYAEAHFILDFKTYTIVPMLNKHYLHFRIPYLENFNHFINKYFPTEKSKEMFMKYMMTYSERGCFAELSLFFFLFSCFTHEGFGKNIFDFLHEKNAKQTGEKKIMKFGENEKYTVLSLKDFLLKYEHIWKEKLELNIDLDKYDQFGAWLLLPTDSKITIENNASGNIADTLIINHKYFNFKFRFFSRGGGRGLSHLNPYSYVIMDSKNKDQELDTLWKNFYSLDMGLEFHATIDFPEENPELFDEYYNFAKLIKEYIETGWDYNNCLKNMPYHYTLFNIEHKLEELFQKLTL